MTREFSIGNSVVTDDGECFVIAEIGHNHQGSLEQAKKLIDAAHDRGADAVKLQKRDNRTLFTREYYARPYDHENSFGKTYGEHREQLEFGRSEYEELMAYANELGISFFATAFDPPSVEFLQDLDIPAYKVASADLTNVDLLRLVAETGQPVILSTGAAKFDDVRRAYELVFEINPMVAVLQCTASYPVAWNELDLQVIQTYRDEFPRSIVGLSAHDNGIAMPIAAYVLGARIIEKHFTLNRAMKGSDHAFSLEPQGLGKMVRDLKRTRLALGDGTKRMYTSEAAAAVKMGKKLVAARDLPAGTELSSEDIVARSPGDGVPPYEAPRFIGRTLRYPVMADAELTFDLLEEFDPAEELPTAPGVAAGG